MHELFGIIADGRAEAEAIMHDACVIEAPVLDADGNPVRDMDPETLEYTDVYETIYGPAIESERGKCRFKPRDVQGNDVTGGEREFYVGKAELQLPISAPLMPAGLRVTITNSPLDQAQVGRVMWTQDTEPRTHATKRTVSLSEVRDGAG